MKASRVVAAATGIMIGSAASRRRPARAVTDCCNRVRGCPSRSWLGVKNVRQQFRFDLRQARKDFRADVREARREFRRTFRSPDRVAPSTARPGKALRVELRSARAGFREAIKQANETFLTTVRASRDVVECREQPGLDPRAATGRKNDLSHRGQAGPPGPSDRYQARDRRLPDPRARTPVSRSRTPSASGAA